MAIYSIPLMGPEPLPPWTGVEIYVACCRNAYAPQTADLLPPPDEFRAISVMVNLSGEEVDRSAFVPLQRALTFAECTVLDGAAWPERLAETVSSHQPQFATAVIYTGSGDNVSTKAIQSIVDTLRERLDMPQLLVVVVSATPESLVSLQDVRGFVRGANTTNADTARQTFLALASFMANETLADADLEDFLPVLGPALAPTVLAQAFWFSEDDGRLVYLSNADKLAVANAELTFSITHFDASMHGLRNLFKSIRSDASKSTSSVIFTPTNALTPSLLPANVGFVFVLCRRT